MTLRHLAATLCLAIVLAGCATTRSVGPRVAWHQDGMATWYGPELAKGCPTASGERYRDTDYTAAHLHLPFGTRVLVENRRNGRRVIVRINDRGPFGHGRVIDLSGAAARALDMITDGVVPVRLVVVP